MVSTVLTMEHCSPEAIYRSREIKPHYMNFADNTAMYGFPAAQRPVKGYTTTHFFHPAKSVQIQHAKV